MSPRPPRFPYRLLARVLASDEAGPSILGDLREDFVQLAQRAGPLRAYLWYWREALQLAASATAQKSIAFVGGLMRHDSRNGSMHHPLGPHSVFQDARYALRAVRRDLGFAVFAALVVGLGVGASTAVYSVMSPLMIAPLPFEDPGRLVWIANDGQGTSLSAVTSRSNNLRDFRELARSFDGMTGYNAFFNQSSYNLIGDGEAEQLTGVGVAHDFLDVLGVQPIHGRGFTLEEGMWEGPAAVILTHGFWLRRFAGDPSIVGRSITLNDIPREVVGILPPSFDFSSVFTPSVPVHFLRTFAVGDETNRWGNTMSFIGRMAPDVTVESAQADLDGVIRGLEDADPERWGLGAVVSPLQAHIAGPFRSAMLLLAAAAGAVMLIVCVNLSNMLLARSPRRLREMAVRRSLGATRARLVRQLMLESLALSTAGAVIGLGIAVAATRFVAGATGVSIPLLQDVGVDGAALLFTLATATIAGVLVGVFPALQVSEGGEAAALTAASVRSSSHRGGTRLRELLVVAQVALACVLLVFGGLFLRSFGRVLDVDIGWESAGAVAWKLNPTADFETIEEMAAFYREVVDRVEAVPGVESAGLNDALPLGKNRNWGMRIVGREYSEDEGWDGLFPHLIDTGYMETMQIPLLAGRHFTTDDTGESEWVVQINASAAERLFPGEDPIGRRILAGGREMPWRIVGVVADVKHVTLEVDSGNQVYFPIAQMWAFSTLEMVVRSRLPVESVATSVSAALHELDPGMPTDKFWTLEDRVAQAVSPRRFTLAILSAFAATALLLAGIGIYGVLSYSVTERIPEIGIRMALGATGSDVRRRVVGRTLVLAGLGVAIGVGVAIAGSRWIASLLFGVEPTDPLTFGGMVAVLLAVAWLAGMIPAIRASRTDSATALRVS